MLRDSENGEVKGREISEKESNKYYDRKFENYGLTKIIGTGVY